MKQLTFIFMLMLPITFYHCTNLQNHSSQNKKDNANSRSIDNSNSEDKLKNGDDHLRADEYSSDYKTNNSFKAESIQPDTTIKTFQLPDLKSEDYKYLNNNYNQKRTQSLLDDYDPEKF